MAPNINASDAEMSTREAEIAAEGGDPTKASPRHFRRTVAVADIEIDPSYPVDAIRVELCAEMIKRYGLRHPITVTSESKLVGGVDWFAAAQALGLKQIEAWVLENDE